MNDKTTNLKWFWVAIGVSFVLLLVILGHNHPTKPIPKPVLTTTETDSQPVRNPPSVTAHDASPIPEASALLEFETRMDLYKALLKQKHELEETLLSEHPEIPAGEEYLKRMEKAFIAADAGLEEVRALNKKNPAVHRGAQKYLTAYFIANALRSNQPVADTTLSEMVTSVLSDPKCAARVIGFLSDVTASTLGSKGQTPVAAAAPSSGTDIFQLIDEAAEKHRSYFQKMLMDEGISGDSKAAAYMEAESQMCVMRQYIWAYHEQVSPEELLQVNRRSVDLGVRLGELMERAPHNSEARARMLGLWNELRNGPH